MEALLEAKKSVLRDLIGDMRKKMVAMGESPEEGVVASASEPEEGPALEDDEPMEPEESKAPPAPPKSAATITLAAIKKGTAARAPKPSPFEAMKDKPKKKA